MTIPETFDHIRSRAERDNCYITNRMMDGYIKPELDRLQLERGQDLALVGELRMALNTAQDRIGEWESFVCGPAPGVRASSKLLIERALALTPSDALLAAHDAEVRRAALEDAAKLAERHSASCSSVGDAYLYLDQLSAELRTMKDKP